jgi:hypothetical protein
MLLTKISDVLFVKGFVEGHNSYHELLDKQFYMYIDFDYPYGILDDETVDWVVATYEKCFGTECKGVALNRRTNEKYTLGKTGIHLFFPDLIVTKEQAIELLEKLPVELKTWSDPQYKMLRQNGSIKTPENPARDVYTPYRGTHFTTEIHSDCA